MACRAGLQFALVEAEFTTQGFGGLSACLQFDEVDMKSTKKLVLLCPTSPEIGHVLDECEVLT